MYPFTSTLQTYLRHLETPDHYESSRAYHAVGANVMEMLLNEAKVLYLPFVWRFIIVVLCTVALVA